MQTPVRGFLETSGLVTGAGELFGAEYSLPPEKFLPPPLLHFTRGYLGCRQGKWAWARWSWDQSH